MRLDRRVSIAPTERRGAVQGELFRITAAEWAAQQAGG
jgi:hypothetical protein